MFCRATGEDHFQPYVTFEHDSVPVCLLRSRVASTIPNLGPPEASSLTYYLQTTHNGSIVDCSLDHLVRLRVHADKSNDTEIPFFLVDNQEFLLSEALVTPAIASKLRAVEAAGVIVD